MVRARSGSLPFKPKQRPSLSRGEVNAYKAMLDGALSPDASHVSAVVVGAGLSGLAAARELKRAGAKVRILESTGRAGGRCLTVSSPAFDDGVYAEAGGMRFPDSHEIIMKYVEIFRLETIGFSNMKDRDGLLYLNGEAKFIKAELGNPDSLLSRVVAKWEESVGPVRSVLKSGLLSWDDLADVYGKMSIAEFLRENDWSEELVGGFARCGVGLGAYGAVMHLSALEIIRLFCDDHGYESKNVQLKGGMETLSRGFLDDDEAPLRSSIEYGCRVVSVEQQSDGSYQVVGEKGDATVRYRCDFVVATVPLPNLRGISFNPPLSEDVTRAIDNTHYVKAVKIFLQTKSPFWLRDGVDGMIISDMKSELLAFYRFIPESHNTIVPSLYSSVQNTYFAPKEISNGKGLIIASYTWERPAEELFKLSTEEKIRLAIDELKQVLPAIEDEFERGDAVEWEQAFCIFRPGQFENHRHLRNEALPKVFLAGEHTSVEHGYFEGALESGIRAAASVFRSVDAGFFSDFERIAGEEEAMRANAAGNSPGAKDTPSLQLPVQARRLDHYTLICQDAAKVAKMHEDVLGFDLDSIKPINSGTVPEGEVDMLNYILHPPSNKDMVMVVTEGLNDETIFRKYLKKHGPGVHHVAFEVDDVDAAFAAVRGAGIATCGDKTTTDLLSGLKQFFIPPCQGAGFFVELIERPKNAKAASDGPAANGADKPMRDASRPGFFANNSMAKLAQSVRNFVDADEHENDAHEEKKQDDDAIDPGASAGRFEGVGEIAGVELEVPDIASSSSFLVGVLGLRAVRHAGDKIFLSMPGSSVAVVVARAESEREERRATVMFDAPRISTRRPARAPNGSEGRMLSERHFSYRVFLAEPSQLALQRKVVRSDAAGLELSVHIRANLADVVAFLERPNNLAQWTGHKCIRLSKSMSDWVETRMSPKGRFKDYKLQVVVTVEEDSGVRVRFSWPERNVTVEFVLKEIVPGYCSVAVSLPSQLGELRLSRMKRIMTIELDLLKAIMEGNVRGFIPSQTFRSIQRYCLGILGAKVRNDLPEDAPRAHGFKGTVIRDGSVMEMMSTDFALTIRSEPVAVLVPKSSEDIQAAVEMAAYLDIPLACRGSRVSHSAGGQAQADNGLVLDMSSLSSVEISDDGSNVRAGPGAYWDEVIRATLARGSIPPVINDYQYLSVGGTLSMGGVGFMSHKLGVQAAHVIKMDVVNGNGDLVNCSADENVDLFDFVRGGLGQCGIITSATLPLVPAPEEILIFKVFYRAEDVQTFADEVARIVGDGRVDMIHAFLKPRNVMTLVKIVGDESFSSSSNEFRNAIEDGKSQSGLVFFLELGCYIWDAPDDAQRVAEAVETLLTGSECIGGEVFTERETFRNYIARDPPVVATNKVHGSIPHPSFATIVDEGHVVEVLNLHIDSIDRGDDALNEILIMPVRSNERLGEGRETPMLPLPVGSDLSFFLLFLGSVVPSASASAEAIAGGMRDRHRGLHELSRSLGGKRYSYCTLTGEVAGEAAWREHYGSRTWERFRAAKRKHDPNHLFSPGIKIWD